LAPVSRLFLPICDSHHANHTTLGAPAFADAQSDRMQALEKRLENSVALIEKLTSRIADLERGGKPANTSTAAMASSSSTDQAQSQAIASLEQSVKQLSEGMGRSSVDTGLPLHGFADVGAGWSSKNDPSRQRGFNGGTLDLFLAPQFGERVKALVELAVEFGDDGHAALDLERLQLGYTVNDQVTLWAGRFHTPLGLWNTSFHHGANLQTSIYRPRFIDFEDKGGIVPAHSIGVWASGKTKLGAGKLSYDAYLSNGAHITDRTLDFGANTDDNHGKMLGFNVGYSFGGSLSGLTVGAHGFGSTVNTYDTASTVLNTTKVRMGGAYFGYDENDWEMVGEYYRFANADQAGGGSRTSNAWFVQVGKTFGSVTPFMRLEKAALNPLDNYFLSQASGRSYQRTALGLRYAVDPKASFKFEVSNTNETAIDQLDENGGLAPFAGGKYRRAALQYSIAF
jgi:hypothetical protein